MLYYVARGSCHFLASAVSSPQGNSPFLKIWSNSCSSFLPDKDLHLTLDPPKFSFSLLPLSSISLLPLSSFQSLKSDPGEEACIFTPLLKYFIFYRLVLMKKPSIQKKCHSSLLSVAPNTIGPSILKVSPPWSHTNSTSSVFRRVSRSFLPSSFKVKSELMKWVCSFFWLRDKMHER